MVIRLVGAALLRPRGRVREGLVLLVGLLRRLGLDRRLCIVRMQMGVGRVCLWGYWTCIMCDFRFIQSDLVSGLVQRDLPSRVICRKVSPTHAACR